MPSKLDQPVESVRDVKQKLEKQGERRLKLASSLPSFISLSAKSTSTVLADMQKLSHCNILIFAESTVVA